MEVMLGEQLYLIILKLFSNLNNAIILFYKIYPSPVNSHFGEVVLTGAAKGN